ncbi:hypothetical protein NM688_g5207 [Phlebia brevispora]|uniref:Uncharacterized protein n=1 Tax=Phlebia brevispora TaxID=194682 RepID=A0ACC1SYX8_9APHY|nr:hypothetical protein NM688_g5207 [Phlebia brevispora]
MPEKQKIAAKRKRDVPKKEDDLSKKLTGKLHHSLKDVRKAAKKAKAFEIQKLVKRLKGLRAKTPQSEEISSLESELEILKRTDHEPFAHTALKSKVKKDKLLSGNEHMKVAVAAELSTNLVQPAEPGSHLAKVQRRLLSSKNLASEVSIVIELLRLTIQPPPKNVDQDSDNDNDEESAEGDIEPPTKKKKVVEDSNTTVEHDSDEDEDEEGEEDGRVVLSEGDSDIDDGGWESGSINDGDAFGGKDEGGSEDEEGVASGDEDEDDNESGNDDERKASVQSKPTKARQATESLNQSKSKKSADSTFLPSLSVGFIRGDSDASDWSDSEAKVADSVRKNRRGQRARRAIWEKKYGKNANHVKKQREISGRDERAHVKRGPDRGHADARRSRNQPRQAANTAPATSRSSSQFNRMPSGTCCMIRPSLPACTDVIVTAVAHEHKKEDKPLHPSWEAKRKLKEMQNPGIVPAQGKKIVF